MVLRPAVKLEGSVIEGSPRQPALQFADAAGRGVELTPPPFRQADMPNLRIKVTADILAGKVA